MKPNETQLQQALKHYERQTEGMVLTYCIPNTQRHQGVIQTVQQRCQQSQIHQQASMQGCKKNKHHSKNTAQHSTTRNGHIEDA
jgi:hypothetical protein